MGYTLPYVPVEKIQYDNRMNFNIRRSVSRVEPIPNRAMREVVRDQQKDFTANLLGKGKNVDESV